MASNPKLKLMVLILLSVFLFMGCSMDNKKNHDFRQDALNVLETLDICIENFGFPEAARLEMNEFFDTKHKENTKEIKKRIASVYMAFLGKTNFRDKNDPKNKDLFEGLLREIEEINLLLEKYQETV